MPLRSPHRRSVWASTCSASGRLPIRPPSSSITPRSQGAKVVHFSEIRFIGSLDDANLKQVREHAGKLGIEVEIGMRSICPTSKAFDPKQGTAEQQIARMIHAANVVGSPIVRAFLGTSAGPPGSRAASKGHIEDTVKVLQSRCAPRCSTAA